MISRNCLKYFISTTIITSVKIPSAALSYSADVFPNNLFLYLKDLKLSVFAKFALKSVASSLT